MHLYALRRPFVVSENRVFELLFSSTLKNAAAYVILRV